DERLRDEAAAVRAEAAPRVGHVAHGRFEERQDALHGILAAAARAAFTNARTRSLSLNPSRPSIPEATSTPWGCAAWIASPTFSGVRPPATKTSASTTARTLRASDQANETPPPPPAGPSSKRRLKPRSAERLASAGSSSTWTAA